MTPEDKARQAIDSQLLQTGWVVQDRSELNISAALGVAVREFSVTGGEADYLLYAEGRVIGVVEAKPPGHTLAGVETQSGKYARALPPGVPAHRLPLPFRYETTGAVTQFTNRLDPDARSREVFTFHQPEELLRLVGLERQVRGALDAADQPDAHEMLDFLATLAANPELLEYGGEDLATLAAARSLDQGEAAQQAG